MVSDVSCSRGRRLTEELIARQGGIGFVDRGAGLAGIHNELIASMEGQLNSLAFAAASGPGLYSGDGGLRWWWMMSVWLRHDLYEWEKGRFRRGGCLGGCQVAV